jgi:hypothetical protein
MRTTDRKIIVNKTVYHWTVEPCEDCSEVALYVDFGNGRPEHIGYSDTKADYESLVRREIETKLA